MISKTISHYQILDKLGQGGMGVVYKALDTKLDRTVALKFLPEYTLSTDEDKTRFQREAKAAAQLNHPHICTIYEIDESDDGQAFIAMEYIEGETLAEKIQRGPLKLQEAITIACQVAEGLQAAHEQGIVHRDVKSGNVMLTEKGQVKIMDFGLAKVEAASILTKEGTTMGTAVYMSPEQAQGKAVDHRSDIWSLGVVLYEMITGQRPFKGDYEQAIIYALVNQDPEPLTALRTGVPLALDGVIAKALAKDPALRYQHADEVPADLRAIDVHPSALATLSTTRRTAAPAEAPARRPLIPWIVAAVMAVMAVLALWSPWRVAPQAPTSHLVLLSEPSERFMGDGGFALSPDGSRVVFTGRSGATGPISQLFLRSFDEPQATPLPGTEISESPFFSPDGQWIGFISGIQMKKVSVSGGRPIPIYEGLAADASWGPGNQIIFTQPGSGRPGELMLVSAQGGQPKPLPASEDDAHQWAFTPHFLPGGRAVLFMTRSAPGPNIEDASIVVQSLDTNERRTLIRSGTNPHYAPTGHLIFGRAGTIMAAPFDLKSLTLTGPAVPVVEGVYRTINYGKTAFSLSNTGTLLYRAANQSETSRRMVWVDRSGAAQVVAAEPHLFHDPRLSPNGQRIAVFSRDIGTEAWVYERDHGTLMRLTVNPGEDETVAWSPNGQWIAFASVRPDQTRAVLRTPSDGSGAEEVLWTSDYHAHVESWSPDGQALILTVIDPRTREDLWMLHLEGKPEAQPLIQTAFREFGGRVSPDGRWLAYVSDESGRLEVYVQAYPNLGQKMPVSSGGGTQPVWGASGRTLYYRGEESVMEVTVTPGERFTVSAIEPLFIDRNAPGEGNHTGYDVAGDGEQFLMIEGEGAENPWTALNVVLNWLEDVKQRVPTNR